MGEQFANERKNIRPKSRRIKSLAALFLLCGGVRPTPANNAMKNHSIEGSINTTVGKSGFETSQNITLTIRNIWQKKFDNFIC